MSEENSNNNSVMIPSTPKPKAPTTTPANLPPTLQRTGKFCNWNYIWKGNRWTKAPINPNTGGGASSTDPNTFGSLDDAKRGLSRLYDGIGVGLFDELGAIDIDHCVDDNGKLTPEAQDIVKTMNAYTEISPSGHGIRILFSVFGFYEYDTKKYYINNQKAGIEVYIAEATAKYVTVTGNTLTPGMDLEERSDELNEIAEKYMKRPPKAQASAQPVTIDLTDRDLLDKARANATTGESFCDLYDRGNIGGYPSHSEADLSLCKMLAFWTGCDADRMDRLFRTSALMRDKWTDHGGQYGQRTINAAISACGKVYDPEQYRDDDFIWTKEDSEGLRKMKERAQASTEDDSTATAIPWDDDDDHLFDDDDDEDNNTVSINPTTSASDALSAPYSDETATGEQVQADEEKTPENGSESVADNKKNKRPSTYSYSVGYYLTDGAFDSDIDYFRKYKSRKTGYRVIDHYLTLYPGVAALGGSSSLGKTTFAVNLCVNLVRRGETVLYFSLEQEPIEIVTKILARRLIEEYPGTPLTNIDIKDGATSDELEKVKKECAEDFGDRFQIIRCDFSITATRIRNIIESYIKDDPDCHPVCVIDYLQLVAPPDDFRGDARAAIDENIKTFKSCQRDNELFMILVSSFNRANYETPASFEDFKESGMVEYSCDYVWELQVSVMEDPEFYQTEGARGGIREKTKKEKSDSIAAQLKKKQRPVEFVSLKSRNGQQRYEAYFLYDVEHDVFTPESGTLYAKDPAKTGALFAKLYPEAPADPVKDDSEDYTREGFEDVSPEYKIPFN